MRPLLRLSSALIVALWLIPETAFQQTLPTIPVGGSPCFLNLPCIGGGAAGLSTYLFSNVYTAARTVFLALSIVFFLQYSVRLLLESDDDSTISEVKSAYAYGISGMVVVALATFIVDAFGTTAGGTLVNNEPVSEGLGNVIFYFRIMVATAVSALILTQGVRLIILQGQESELEQQKKKFFHGLLGVGIILLANAAVSAFLPGENSSILAQEIIGIANFLATFVGALAVLSFVAAGAFLIFSVDEGLKDRAKKAMFTATVAIIVVLTCYVLVKYFITL